MKDNKKVVISSILGVTCLILLTLSLTYAYWQINKNQTGENVVNTACLNVTIDNEQDDISLTKAYPISDEDGYELTPYKFTITNHCEAYSDYTINLEMLDITDLNSNFVRVALKEVNKPKTSKVLGKYTSYDNLKLDGTKEGRTITKGKLGPLEYKNYELRIWLDKDVKVTDDVMNKTYQSKIVVEGVIGSEKEESTPVLLTEYITELSESDTTNLINDETVDTNLRYIGSNPNNYLNFNCEDYENQSNCEKWRIIGILKVKTSSGETEERLKIIRTNGISGQNDFPAQKWSDNQKNDWTQSTLKTLLNTTYYNGESVDTVKGITTQTQAMIDKDITWNIAGVPDQEYKYNVLANQFYTEERGTRTANTPKEETHYPNEWTIENDTTEHNGIGLMYASDYSYAVGKTKRESCFAEYLSKWGGELACGEENWLVPHNSTNYDWTMTPDAAYYSGAFYVSSNGYIQAQFRYVYYNAFGISPTLYLVKNIDLLPNQASDLEYGSIDNPFQIQIKEE